MNLLWVCCYDANYPWGAEVAMMNGFAASDWNIDYVDYRMAAHLGIDAHSVINRRAKNADAILIQRGEGLDFRKISTNKPIFYFATESKANEDQAKSFDQALGIITKIFARKETKKQAISIGHDPDDVLIFTLPFNHLHYKPIETEKIYDVILSGTVTPRRLEFYNKIIEEVNKWGKAGHTDRVASECNEIYNTAKTIVNIHSYDVLDTETRVFEAMATSSLLITEELADDIDINGKCLTFESCDIDQCIDHIRWAGKNWDKCKTMIKKANKLSKKNSWALRASDLLKMIKDNA